MLVSCTEDRTWINGGLHCIRGSPSAISAYNLAWASPYCELDQKVNFKAPVDIGGGYWGLSPRMFSQKVQLRSRNIKERICSTGVHHRGSSHEKAIFVDCLPCVNSFIVATGKSVLDLCRAVCLISELFMKANKARSCSSNCSSRIWW